MDWQTLEQFIRICMQFIGGMLVTYGWIDEAGLVSLTGAVVSVGAFVWWLVWVRKQNPTSPAA